MADACPPLLPPEAPAPDLDGAAEHLARAFAALGFPDDPEMRRSPQQVAAFLAELVPRTLPACKPLPTRSHDLVVIREIPFHSVCAHHLLPFFGTVDIAWRPAGRLVGLGWFPGLVEALARRPQLQERLAAQLADEIEQALSPSALTVALRARQMCVEMRGSRSSAWYEVRVRRGEADPELDAALPMSARPESP